MGLIEDLIGEIDDIRRDGRLDLLSDSTLPGTALHDRLGQAAHELDAALQGLRTASPSSPVTGTQPGRTDRVPVRSPGEGQGREDPSPPPSLTVPSRAPRPLPGGAREDRED